MAVAAVRQVADLPEMSRDVEVAELSGISAVTLRRWRAEGKGPKFVRIGERAIRYRRADVLAWLDSLDSGGEAA